MCLRVDRAIIRNFHHNLNKARALAKAQGYLEGLRSDGSAGILGIFGEIQTDFFKIIGIDDFDEMIAQQLEKRIEQQDPELLEQMGKQLARKLTPHLNRIQAIFNDAELLMNEVLLEQAVVNGVTAFEVYCRDTAISVIGRNQTIHQRFHSELVSGLNYNEIEKSDFDLERSIGTTAIKSFDFYQPNSIRTLYSRILEDKSVLSNANQRKRIHRFIQLRHIIVHKSGMVDEQYKRNVNYPGKIGDKISISRKYVLDSLGTIRKTVEEIQSAIEMMENP